MSTRAWDIIFIVLLVLTLYVVAIALADVLTGGAFG